MKHKIKSAIFDIMDKSSSDSGRILIEDVYRLLKQEYNIDRVSAGKAIIELCKSGEIASYEYYYLRRG